MSCEPRHVVVIDADIEAEHDSICAVFIHPAHHGVRRRHGYAANDYPRHAQIEQSLEPYGIADAAAHLKLRELASGQPCDDLQIFL